MDLTVWKRSDNTGQEEQREVVETDIATYSIRVMTAGNGRVSVKMAIDGGQSPVVEAHGEIEDLQTIRDGKGAGIAVQKDGREVEIGTAKKDPTDLDTDIRDRGQSAMYEEHRSRCIHEAR